MVGAADQNDVDLLATQMQDEGMARRLHDAQLGDRPAAMMTHKYRGSQQSSREVKPKFIDSAQEEPKDIYKS
jgi:hypothetical protein